MSILNKVLRDGREIRFNEQEAIEKAKQEGLCSKYKEKYVKCANPSDPDYKYIKDRDCQGRVSLNAKKPICDECNRTITEIETKETFSVDKVSIDRNGVRDYIRNNLKNEVGGSVRTVSRTYHTQKFEHVLHIEERDCLFIIIYKNVGRSVIKWIRTYDEDVCLVLVGEGNGIKEAASEFNLAHVCIGDILDSDASLFELTQHSIKKDILADRSLKGEIALDLGRSEQVLESMNYDDFEHLVQNLLVGSIGNSKIIGSTEGGSGVPDGALCLCYNNESNLFMWDAKFVDYEPASDNETELKDEYDKIFRHLRTLEQNPGIRNKFGEVKSIILFSPGIKESNVSRLAEFIEENQFLSNISWSGTICYFTFDALLRLYDLYNENESDVKRKEISFRMALDKYLSSLTKHEDDPEKIRNSTAKTVKFDKEDTERLFDDLDTLGAEEDSFSVDEYMKFLDLVTN